MVVFEGLSFAGQGRGGASSSSACFGEGVVVGATTAAAYVPTAPATSAACVPACAALATLTETACASGGTTIGISRATTRGLGSPTTSASLACGSAVGY